MAKDNHLYEVDLLRACIILGVLCVHVMSFFNLFTEPFAVDNVVYEGLLTTFHFTRESFMFITGLVLFITYYHRSFRVLSFWGKRLKLILIPYVAWTVIYILFEGTYVRGFDWTFAGVVMKIVDSLLFGKQFFLYYLLVSMQLYIVFPILVWFLRKFEAWHVIILVISFVIEIGLMWLNQGVLQQLNTQSYPFWLQLLIKYRDRFVITYEFWFIAGAIVAVHYKQVRGFLERNPRLILGLFICMAALLWGHFLYQRLLMKEPEEMAVLVLQPIMVPYSITVTLLLLNIGIRWANHRLDQSLQHVSAFIQIAARASFGVFLVHPIFLHYLSVLVYTLHMKSWLREALTPVSIVLVYLISIAFAHLVGTIPYVGYIVGQKVNLRKKQVQSAAAS